MESMLNIMKSNDVLNENGYRDRTGNGEKL